jgi:DNA-binding MarR family transcriptional regulator
MRCSNSEGIVATATQVRSELLKKLDEALRKVSAQSVLISDTVAKLVGLNATDLECLDLLYLAGPTTAGRLARHSGLTTGAMTAVIDRLEEAGFARRLRDREDRRCVLVEALPAGIKLIEPLYRPLAASTAQLHERYDNRELAIVVDYLSNALALAAEHAKWLQTQPPTMRRRPVTRRRRSVGGERSSVTEVMRA